MTTRRDSASDPSQGGGRSRSRCGLSHLLLRGGLRFSRSGLSLGRGSLLSRGGSGLGLGCAVCHWFRLNRRRGLCSACLHNLK